MRTINHLPEWIRWVAQDQDGTWWGYSVEPLLHDYGWYENEVGRCIKLEQMEAVVDWKNSIRAYPR